VPESIHHAPGRPLLNPIPAMPRVEEAPIMLAQKVPVR